MYEFFAVDLVSDPTYGSTRAMLWCVIEGGTYFMAACMPSLRPLKRVILKGSSFSSLISGIYERVSGTSSRQGSSGVIKTTEIAMEVKFVNAKGRSTASTSQLNLRENRMSDLEDAHDSVSLNSDSVERLRIGKNGH
jgi:hypothetical protein